MSNKVVPTVYRMIIDDVMANIQADFEEYGMEEEVLVALQTKWEAKVLETRVADFARAAAAAQPTSTSPTPPPASSQPGPSNSQNQYGSNPAYQTPQGLALPGQGAYGVTGQGAYGVTGPNGGGYGYNGGGYGDVRVKAEPDDTLRIRGGAPDAKPDAKVEAKVKPEPNAQGLLPGDEVIDSDLDDSDDEQRDDVDGGDDEGDIDIVFCVYDKVQRVKNKWKTVFKDGMVHINGKDYLFSKCNGEFEW